MRCRHIEPTPAGLAWSKLPLLTRSPGWSHAVSVIRAESRTAQNIHNVAAIGVHRKNVEFPVCKFSDVAFEPVADKRNALTIRRIRGVKIVVKTATSRKFRSLDTLIFSLDPAGAKPSRKFLALRPCLHSGGFGSASTAGRRSRSGR
jgi:hypothetical protein